MIEGLIVKDVSFPFRYVRPRLLGSLAAFAALYLIWLGMDPARIDGGSTTGLIDLIVRSMPPLVRSVFCLFSSVFLLWSAYVTYWPCIISKSIAIFDGRYLYGFDFWGHRASILRSEVASIVYRNGGASVRGEKSTIWIPLSLLDMDESSRNGIRDLLNNASS